MAKSIWYLSGSFLLACLHSVGRCHVYYQRRKMITGLTQPWIPWTTIITSQSRYDYCCNRGMDVIEVNNWLNLKLIPQDATHTWHRYQGQNDPTARYVLDPRIEPPIINLLILNWLPITYLYTHGLRHLSTIIREISVLVINIERNNWERCRE